MEYGMKLYSDSFDMIKKGRKDIEIRLNDEKRKNISVGDIITFTNIDTAENITTKCVNLYKAKSFVELFDLINDNERVGSLKSETYEEMSEQMREYYPKEQEEKYGVLGIEFVILTM